MSKDPPSDKPKHTSSSQVKAIKLDETLGGVEAQAHIEKGREALSTTTGSATKVDLEQGVATFSNAVDSIVDALLLIISKFDNTVAKVEHLTTASDELTTQTKKNLRLLWAGAFTGLLVCCVLGWVGRGVYKLVDQVQATNTKNEELTQKLVELEASMRKVGEDAKNTSAAVDKIKENQENKPDISVVTDEKGTVKVAIKPKEAEPTATTPAPQPKAVEIELKLPPGAVK